MNENEADEEEVKDNADMMFYTGEDLSQKQNGGPSIKGSGRSNNNNDNTLASLNERKFQTRKSEQELQGFFYHEKNNTTNLTTASTHHKAESIGIVAGLGLRSGAEIKEVPAALPVREPTTNGVEIVDDLNIDLRRVEDYSDYEQQTEDSPESANATTSLMDFRTQSGSESSRSKMVHGLKSVENPDVIKFKEQSEWLDKMVSEEVKAQKMKKEKGKLTHYVEPSQSAKMLKSNTGRISFC